MLKSTFGVREQFGRPRVRKDLRMLTADEINDLRNAYEALYAIDNANDERGYTWIAGRHGFPGNYCHRDENDFWTWHRAYLYEFEQRLRDAFVKAHPDATELSLPWWDWTLTDATTDDAYGIPKVLDEPEYTDLKTGKKKPNPLFSAYSIATQKQTFRDPRAFKQHIPDFASNVESVKTTDTFLIAQGLLNNGAHGAVHIHIGGVEGGDMRSIRTSAFDPLFWMHHCFIDKLFWEWQRDHKNATIPQAQLDFVTAPFHYTGKEMLDPEGFLGYTYRDFETTTTTDAKTFQLAGPVAADEVAAVAPAAMGPIKLQLQLGPGVERARKARLVFMGMKKTKHSYEVRVFLNAPEITALTAVAEDAHPAGTLFLFGHGDCIGGPGHCQPPSDRRNFDQRPQHHYSPFNAFLDVSGTIHDALARSPVARLDVSIVVVDRVGRAVAPAEVGFDAVSLETA
jgi:tyrosinase